MFTKSTKQKLWTVGLFSILISATSLRLENKKGGIIGQVLQRSGGNPDGGGTVGGPRPHNLTVARGGTIGRTARSGGTIG